MITMIMMTITASLQKHRETVTIQKSIIKASKSIVLPIRLVRLIKCGGCMKKLAAANQDMQCTRGCIGRLIWREYERVHERYVTRRPCSTALPHCGAL